MTESSEPTTVSQGAATEPNASILLVDDSPANLLALRAVLEDLDVRLVEAGSGEEALNHVHTREFALILLDVMMPTMSGFETAKLMRQYDRSRHTPIIFLTANEIDASQLEEGYRLGAVDFLVKPFLSVALRAKAGEFIELYRQRQQSRRKAQQLRLLVEGTKDYAIFLLDAQGRVASWNPGAERIKQYRAEEILGQHFSRFYPKEAVERGWPEYELEVARAEGRFEDEGWRVRKDGTKFWANVVITALYDEAGDLQGFSKITRDMTERKQAEENTRRLLQEEAARHAAEEHSRQLEEQREWLRVTLASIGDAVIATDAKGCVTFINPVAEKLTGWRQVDAEGQPLQTVFSVRNERTGQPIGNPVERVLREGVVVGLGNHTILTARDGVERPIDDSAAPIHNSAGGMIGVVLIFRDVTEQRRIQSEARQSEARFRGLMEQAPFSIQVFSPHGRTVQVNRAWEELWGVRFEQIADYNILEDRQLEARGVLHYIHQGFAGQATHVPAIQYNPNDTIPNITQHEDPRRWLSAVIYPLKDAEGRVREVVLIHEDITARKRAESALKESEERFRATVDQAAVGVAQVGLDRRTIWTNPGLCSMLGYTQVEMREKTFIDVTHPDDLDTDLDLGRQLIAGEIPSYRIENRYLHKNGSIIWGDLAVSLVRDACGAPQYIVGMVVDITERKRVEEELRRALQQKDELLALLDTLQQNAPVGFAFVDREFRYIRINEALAAIDGNVPAHHLGRTVQESVPKLWPKLEPLYRGVLESGQSLKNHEVTGETPAAPEQTRNWLVNYYPVRVKESVVGIGVLVTDITERKRLEDELRQQAKQLKEADRRKDEFLATLAHELRNPLAPIRNSLEILKMPWVDAETAQQTREVMERQVDQLVRLVDDLLDVSRVMRGKIELRKEAVELSTVVARAIETAQPLIEVQRHRLDISMPPESLLLDADPVRLAQVIGNLLTNAAKYTEAEGHIRVIAQREGDEAILRVQDNGIGIAPDMQPHVFDLFVQVEHGSARSQGGLGIGLTLVKNLVEMHQGRVEAHSAGLGKGCEFVVRLPLAIHEQQEPTVAGGGERQHNSKASGLRLLVVDDNKDAATSLAMLLRLQGHEVQVVHDGPSALQLAISYRPALVLLDLGMPGMDGYEVARRLRETPGLERILLAALTGWGQQEDRRRTAEAGFDHHLVKPLEAKTLEDLLANLREHVERSR